MNKNAEFNEIEFYKNALPKILLNSLSIEDIQLGQQWYKYLLNKQESPELVEQIKLMIFYAQHGHLEGPFMHPPDCEQGGGPINNALDVAHNSLDAKIRGVIWENKLGDANFPKSTQSNWYRPPNLEEINAITDPLYIEAFENLKNDPDMVNELFRIVPCQVLPIHGDSSLRCRRRFSVEPYYLQDTEDAPKSNQSKTPSVKYHQDSFEATEYMGIPNTNKSNTSSIKSRNSDGLNNRQDSFETTEYKTLSGISTNSDMPYQQRAFLKGLAHMENPNATKTASGLTNNAESSEWAPMSISATSREMSDMEESLDGRKRVDLEKAAATNWQKFAENEFEDNEEDG